MSFFSFWIPPEMLAWFTNSLLHGSLLALATLGIVRWILRSRYPEVQVLLWTVVLLKFILPPLLPTAYSLSGLLPEVFAPSSSAATLPLHQTTLPATGLRPEAAASWTLSSLLLTGLVGAYLLGLLWKMARLARSLLARRRALRHMDPAPRWLRQEVCRLSTRAGLSRKPQVRLTPQQITPFVCGLFRPLLVLPQHLLQQLRPEERRTLLWHELAHIRRGDILIRWIQEAAGLLFYFWPPVLWVSRRLELAIEIACDRWAVERSELEPAEYARSLLKVFKTITTPLAPQPLAFASRKSLLEERFKMILKRSSQSEPKFNRLTILIFGIWALFSLAGGTLAETSPSGSQGEEELEIVLQTSEDPNDLQLPGHLLPRADLNSDGHLTLEELEIYRENHPEEVSIWITQQPDQTQEVRVRILGEGAPAEPGEAEEHVAVEEHITVEEPGHRMLFFESKEFGSILEEHPEADLNADGELDLEELDALLESQNGSDIVLHLEDEDGNMSRKLDVKIVRARQGEQTAIPTGDGNFTELEEFAWRAASEDDSAGKEKKIIIMKKRSASGEEGPHGHLERTTPLSPEERRQEFLRLHPEADQNGDGVISQEEAEALAKKGRGPKKE